MIGASGTIGSAVAQALRDNQHEVVGELDAVVCCAASGQVIPLAVLDDFRGGINGSCTGR